MRSITLSKLCGDLVHALDPFFGERVLQFSGHPAGQYGYWNSRFRRCIIDPLSTQICFYDIWTVFFTTGADHLEDPGDILITDCDLSVNLPSLR